ncbi:MAG: hypothetical protein H6Q20_2617, partial [Bacteroidetes bacterium]|nr:hypothetical protein [Bacteroidota bacterium]
AHEVGHGLFQLRHTFDYSGIKQGALPDNLMDYSAGNQLSKLQWDLIHDPGLVFGLFETDKGGQMSAGNKVKQLIDSLKMSYNQNKTLYLKSELHLSKKEIWAGGANLKFGKHTYKSTIGVQALEQIDSVNTRALEIQKNYREVSRDKYFDIEIGSLRIVLRNEHERDLLVEYIIENFKSLDVLIKLEEIPASEIKQYRDFIKTLPEDKQAEWYLELQKHVPYHSQRDNDQKPNIADRMCNLTSLAMNFELLGISCPDPSMQFEDWLEQERKNIKPEILRTYPESWMTLAAQLGVQSENISLWTNDKNKIVNAIMKFLEQGASISLSAFPKCKGHIVRVQGIADEGLIIDDPFGSVNNFQQRNDCGSGYSGTTNDRDNDPIYGNNNLWKWEDIKKTIIKYVVVFYKN